MTRFCLLLLVWLLLPFHASAQEAVRKADVVRLLEKLQLEQNNPDALQAAGFRGEKLQIMLDHNRRLAGNRAILGFIADQLLAARSGQTRAPLGGLLTPLLNRGMPYMPVRDQIYHMRVELTVMQAMNTNNCGRIVKETIPPQVLSQALSATVSRLNAPALKEYLRIVRKASTLGVSRPNPPRMSDAQRTAVMARFTSALEARAAAKGLGRATARADENLKRLSNREACQLGILFVETILDTKGADQRPLLQLFWRDFS